MVSNVVRHLYYFCISLFYVVIINVDVGDVVMFLYCCIAVRVIRNDMSECTTGELGNIVVK